MKPTLCQKAIGSFVVASMMCAAGLLPTTASQAGEFIYLDLTHPLPTFEPSAGDFAVPGSSVRNFPLADVARPQPDSTGFTGDPTHLYLVPNGQAVLGHVHFVPPAPTRFHKTLTTFAFNPNLGTSIDAPAHRDVLDPVAVAAAIGFGLSADDFDPEDRRHINELRMDELTGKIVFIDINERVQSEIDAHGGDIALADFSNSSGNNVEGADIDAIANELEDGAWVIIRTDWDQFFHSTTNYGNNNNHPGITPEAVVRLVDLEKKLGIRINGIGADNRAVDTGQSLGDGGAASTPAHNVGLNRGWKLLENLTNLQELANVKNQEKMTLIVAPTNLIGAAESYARVYAQVKSKKKKK